MPPQHTRWLCSAEAAAGFNWRQSYDENDFSRHFLNNYGWVMLAGRWRADQGGGPADHAVDAGAGGNLSAPQPRGREIYQIIAGEVEIDTGDTGWQHYTRA